MVYDSAVSKYKAFRESPSGYQGPVIGGPGWDRIQSIVRLGFINRDMKRVLGKERWARLVHYCLECEGTCKWTAVAQKAVELEDAIVAASGSGMPFSCIPKAVRNLTLYQINRTRNWCDPDDHDFDQDEVYETLPARGSLLGKIRALQAASADPTTEELEEISAERRRQNAIMERPFSETDSDFDY